MGTTTATQLIDGDGVFNANGLHNFMKNSNMANTGLSYVVVSIMGPQSSGKSTLLNQLFRTNFKEMDAFEGRSQTTKGILIAKCTGIEPCTIAMDLEGTDGRERGEDDTAFEKQSALFALAVSDIVLINMWCHEIGREQASNKPLLRTVFQVMMRLFTPRKTTLLFVIRDKTKTPLEKLERVLREDIQKIWDAVPKPQAHVPTPLSEFFDVRVTALSSYEDKEEKFKEEVAQLRQHFYNSIAPGGLAGDRRGAVPASAFSISAQHIWKVIQEKKDLDLPAHKVMVATVRCEEIADEKLSHLRSDKGWLELEKFVQSDLKGFQEKLSSIVATYLSLYDEETIYFDADVRNAKRKQFDHETQLLITHAIEAEVKFATVRCEEIAEQKLSHLRSHESWLELEETVQSSRVQGLEEALSSILDIYLCVYDEETINFDADVRNAKRKQFEHDIQLLMKPVQEANIRNHQKNKKFIRKALGATLSIASVVIGAPDLGSLLNFM